jgi:hypothetical protein
MQVQTQVQTIRVQQIAIRSDSDVTRSEVDLDLDLWIDFKYFAGLYPPFPVIPDEESVSLFFSIDPTSVSI